MSRRRISNSREVKAIWLTVGWADGFKLVWEAGDVAGGREGKGGRSGRGGEINPRGVKARRGKEEGGGLKGPPKKSGSRVSAWWRAVETLGRGFIGGPGCNGVSLSIRGECVCVWEHLGAFG